MEWSKLLAQWVDELQESPSLERRVQCARHLGTLGPLAAGAVAALARATLHESPLLRRHALWALGKMGPAAEPALKEVVAGLRDADLEIAKTAGWALSRMGPAAAPALCRQGASGSFSRRRRVRRAFRRMGDAALPRLIEAFGDRRNPERPWCAYGLWRWFSRTPEAFVALTDASRDAEVCVRAWAIAALRHEADDSVLLFLRGARADPWFKPLATWALGRLRLRGTGHENELASEALGLIQP